MPIKDETRVKDRIVLQSPTAGIKQIRQLFGNQLATLEEVRVPDEEMERRNHEVSRCGQYVLVGF